MVLNQKKQYKKRNEKKKTLPKSAKKPRALLKAPYCSDETAIISLAASASKKHFLLEFGKKDALDFKMKNWCLSHASSKFHTLYIASDFSFLFHTLWSSVLVWTNQRPYCSSYITVSVAQCSAIVWIFRCSPTLFSDNIYLSENKLNEQKKKPLFQWRDTSLFPHVQFNWRIMFYYFVVPNPNIFLTLSRYSIKGYKQPEINEWHKCDFI